MYFPVELILMVKAIVTFESVGQILLPGLDVTDYSQKHLNGVLYHQLNPLRLARESLRGAPEFLDTLVKVPMLITAGLRALEQATSRPPENPFAGMRGTMYAGFCLIAGAILAAFGGPIYSGAALRALRPTRAQARQVAGLPRRRGSRPAEFPCTLGACRHGPARRWPRGDRGQRDARDRRLAAQARRRRIR